MTARHVDQTKGGEEARSVAREEFVIDGRAFGTMRGFYDEVEHIFTLGIHQHIGRNLEAFNDVLEGGFGRHEYGAPIRIRWLHFAKSDRDLGLQTMATIEEIISGHDCVLVKE